MLALALAIPFSAHAEPMGQRDQGALRPQLRTFDDKGQPLGAAHGRGA